MRRAALPLFLVLIAGCGSPAAVPSLWFVHATDPHLFSLSPADAFQDQLSQGDFANLLTAAGSPRDAAARPAFLVLTGDLGLEALSRRVLASPQARADKIKQLADALRASPLKDIYYVLGNNDVCGEEAMGSDVDDAEEILGDVNRQLGSQVTLHDLTACYQTSRPSSLDACSADVGSGYRLIGFPSQSFKAAKANRDCDEAAARARAAAGGPRGAAPRAAGASGAAGGAGTAGSTGAAGTAAAAAALAVPAPAPNVPPTRDAQQKVQVEIFLKLVTKAAADGKRVLVVTHIAELDDPYLQAQNLFAGVKNRRAAPRPPWSAWDVSPEILQKWQRQVDSDVVIGILAGHFHDSHRAVYYPPYAWSTAAGDRARKDKVLLAPPLSIRFQSDSPYQARGFALVRLDDDRIWRRLYWYDGHGSFLPDPAERTRSAPQVRSASWPGASLGWLWELAADMEKMQRAAIWAIALLAAFLTSVQVWQIPPPTTRMAIPAAGAPAPPAAGAVGPAAAAGGAGGAAGGSGGGAAGGDGAKSGPFDSNFAKTIIGGLVGMFAVSALESLWRTAPNSGFDPKIYYLVLFVAFFLAMLTLSAMLRSAAEALRSRILLPLPAGGAQQGGAGAGSRHSRWSFISWAGGSRRAWRWLLSLRTPLLVFGDTFFNVIQGKNQLQTAIFAKSIIDLQMSLSLAADKTARAVHRALLRALKCAGMNPDDADVRVNVSVLADDQQWLYYVSWEPGSSSRSFAMNSVAWVAVRAGRARWWKSTYTTSWDAGTDPAKFTIPLYVGDPLPPLPPPQPTEKQLTLMLKAFFQDRGPIDYEAFIVLPIPWRQRDGAVRRSGLHISFKTEKMMDAIWDGLDDAVKKLPAYDSWLQLLDPKTICGKAVTPTSPASAAGATGAASAARAAGPASPAPAAGASTPTPLPAGATAVAPTTAVPASGGSPAAGAPAGPPPGGSGAAAPTADCGPICIKDEALQQVLQQSLAVLAEVLRPFNEAIFLDYIRPPKEG